MVGISSRRSGLGYGAVEREITPEKPGRIKFRGTYWKAKLAASASRRIGKGEKVKVLDMQGISLMVVPDDNEVSYDWLSN